MRYTHTPSLHRAQRALGLDWNDVLQGIQTAGDVAGAIAGKPQVQTVPVMSAMLWGVGAAAVGGTLGYFVGRSMR